MIDESYRAAPFVPSASYTSGPLLPTRTPEEQAQDVLRRDLSLDLHDRHLDADYLTCWEMAGDVVYKFTWIGDDLRRLALLFSADYELSDTTCWEMADDAIRFIQQSNDAARTNR